MELRERLMYYCLSLFALCTGLVVGQSEATTIGTKCYRNEDLGEYAANIYYCAESKKPECCEDEGEFTCCEKKSERTLRHQLILWGAVFGVVGAVAIIWVCYRKDTYMCEGETLGRRMKRCCGCEKKIKPDDEADLSDLSQEKGSVQSLDGVQNPNHTGYYDEHVPITSRQVTPFVIGGALGGEKSTGNDSDSGRGSTMSMSMDNGSGKSRAQVTLGEGVQNARQPDMGSQEPDAQHDARKPQKEKRKRKKNKKKNTKTPDAVIEEEEEDE